MFGIKIKGKFLHLKQGRLSAKLSNPLYLGDSMEVIPGSLLLNTDVPNDDWNAVLLENVDDLQVKRAFLKNEYCEIWFNGSILFLGTLEVIRATDKVFVIRAGLNTISVLKETYMDDIDFGTLNITNLPAQYFLQTLLNPLAHPYIFHPVWNFGFNEKTKPNFLADEYQNFYNNSGVIGDVVQYNGSIVTPFFRLSHVLNTVFNGVGFQLHNGFQKNRELKLITLYNNSAIHTRQGFFNSTALGLNRFLPHKKASDFLKQNLRLFGLGLFYDLFNKQADILTFDDVINGQKVHDWTRHTIVGHEREQVSNTPSRLSFKKNDRSLVPDLAGVARYLVGSLDSNSDPTGLYLDSNTSRALYHENLSDGGATPSTFNTIVRIDTSDSINTGGTKSEFENELVPLQTARIFFDANGNKNAYAPSINQKGFYSDESKIACEPYLMMYRGYRQNSANFVHPFAAHEFDLPFGEANSTGWNVPSVSAPGLMWPSEPTQYSLNLRGEKGIYNRFWKNNFDFINRNRNDLIKKRFTLDIQALREFSFKDKVNVFNQQYLIKEINLEFDASSDYINAEAEMLSLI